MVEDSELFIGLDVSKDSHAVAVAEGGRDGEVRSHGEIGSDAASVRRFVRKLDRPGLRLRFCYEAGPTGYGLKRLIEEMGHECAVIAPSLIPRRPGERVKTNRRDAVKLARLYRAGELTEIWTPDEAHEAMRDLVRAREAAVKDRTRKRQERGTPVRALWPAPPTPVVREDQPRTNSWTCGSDPRIRACSPTSRTASPPLCASDRQAACTA